MSLRPQIVCGAELFVVRELPARHRTRGVSSCRGSPNGAAHSQIAAKLVQGRSDAAGPVAPNRARNISLHPTLAEGIGAMLATTAAASTSTSTSPTPAPSLWVPRPRRTHATLRRARLRGIHGQACASLGPWPSLANSDSITSLGWVISWRTLEQGQQRWPLREDQAEGRVQGQRTQAQRSVEGLYEVQTAVTVNVLKAKTR